MNNSLLFGFKLKPILKVSLAGIFIALACIFNKIVAINYIPVVPFVRISFGGPAIIIFASFLLGPLYGAMIGGFSDILGYLIFDIKAYPYYPSITLTYVLLGLVAGFLFYFLSHFKNEKLSRIILYSSLSIIYILTTVFILTSSEWIIFDNIVKLELWLKLLLVSVTTILLSFMIVYLELLAKRHKYHNEMNIFSITLGMFILDLFVLTIFGTLMKSIAFGFNIFFVILLLQAMTMFFNIPFNVFVFYATFNVGKRFMR